MRLLFDIGNTRLKWAVEEAGSFIASGAFSHAELAATDCLSNYLPALQVSAIWVSNVGNAASLDRLKMLAKQDYGLRAQVITVSESAVGLRNAYADLDKLGVDRWVAAIGARQIVESGAVIIIDAGTAVTVDLLDQHNVYQGGAIIPGVALMHDALTSNTAGIQSDRSSAPPIIGKSTSECVNSGVHYGLVGAVERVVKNMQRSLPRKAAIVLTGGDSKLLKQHAKYSMQLVENLVLTGVLRLASEVEE